MKNKKKYIIIGLIVIVPTILLIIFLLSSKEGKYPSEPIWQKSLVSDNQNIELSDTEIDSNQEYFLWEISESVKLDAVKDMVNSLGDSFKLDEYQEGIFYLWKSGEDSVFFDLDKNYLLFEYSKGIEINEAEIGDRAFGRFVNGYFNSNWNYKVFKTDKGSNGETIYYAKRVLFGDTLVEVREHHQQTDYLALKDGKVMYGKILLTDFVKTDVKVPLISKEDLTKYLNLPNYPKETYPQYSGLGSSLLEEIDYLSATFEEVGDSLSECKSTSSSLIYYYKSFNQELLTPVYKLELQCKIMYKEEEYSVPAISYVNAIHPDYVYQN